MVASLFPGPFRREAQQAVLALHRMRQQKVKFRTAQMNGMRRPLSEYGEVMSKSRAALDKAIPAVLTRLAERLLAMLIESLREMWNDLERPDKQIVDIEQRLQTWNEKDKACHAIAAIPDTAVTVGIDSNAMLTVQTAQVLPSTRSSRKLCGNKMIVVPVAT